MTGETRGSLPVIGVAWKGKPDARHVLRGEIVVAGVRQRFRTFKNARTSPSAPDYLVLAFGAPEAVKPKDDPTTDRETSE